jgi:hypothetical protein
MRREVRRPVQAMPGSTGTGLRTGIAIVGWRGDGNSLPTREVIGTILITIITSKAGGCMKVTGIMRTMTTGNMIEIVDTMTTITITRLYVV